MAAELENRQSGDTALLMQAFEVSRITIRKAMEILAAEGLVTRMRGRGTFVTDRAQRTQLNRTVVSNVNGLFSYLNAVGESTRLRVISLDRGEAPPRIARLMEIAPDHSFSIEMPGGNETSMLAGASVYMIIDLNNTGNTNTTVSMDVMQVPAGWSASLFLQGGSEDQATDLLEVLVPYDEGVTVMLKITAPEDEDAGQWQLLVNMVSFNRNRSVYQGEEQIITITIEEK